MSTPDPAPPTLRVLTFDRTQPEPPCQGGYTCCCKTCNHERAQRVKQGVRRATPLPIRKAA